MYRTEISMLEICMKLFIFVVEERYDYAKKLKNAIQDLQKVLFNLQ